MMMERTEVASELDGYDGGYAGENEMEMEPENDSGIKDYRVPSIF